MNREDALAVGDDHIYFQSDEFGGERGQAVRAPVGEAMFDVDGLALDVAEIAKPEWIVAKHRPLLFGGVAEHAAPRILIPDSRDDGVGRTQLHGRPAT